MAKAIKKKSSEKKKPAEKKKPVEKKKLTERKERGENSGKLIVKGSFFDILKAAAKDANSKNKKK